ncbi:MAG: VOC family protein, partial [Chloroflexi bacterium]|nr:VOC family protein [Chloroflexota bacterium]
RVEAHGGGGFVSPVVSLPGGRSRSFYVADPDGVLVEFIGAPAS